MLGWLARAFIDLVKLLRGLLFSGQLLPRLRILLIERKWETRVLAGGACFFTGWTHLCDFCRKSIIFLDCHQTRISHPTWCALHHGSNRSGEVSLRTNLDSRPLLLYFVELLKASFKPLFELPYIISCLTARNEHLPNAAAPRGRPHPVLGRVKILPIACFLTFLIVPSQFSV